MSRIKSISNNPLISVVMATFNGERFIAEAIESVLNQTFADFEFIIIDDGSIDTTSKIIQSYNDGRIIYIKKDFNSGIADSLNIGIQRAKGKYIARMDDDDVCVPSRFEEQLKVFKKKDILFCGSNVIGNDGKPLRTPEKHEEIFLELLFRNPIFHPTVMIRKDELLKELYNSKSVPSEDYDLWSRLIFKGDFYQIQKPLLFCRIHQTSITARRRKEQLQHNISIVKSIFIKLGYDSLKEHDFYIEAFVSHDYSIKGKELKGLINWFQNLKELNNKKAVFPSQKFEIEADKHLKKFLISYFTNQSLFKKIVPFFYIHLRLKLFILNYYFNKII